MDALGLVPDFKPALARIDEQPQLKRLTWNRPGTNKLAEHDALALYERHWDLVVAENMTAHQGALLCLLVDKDGQGILHICATAPSEGHAAFARHG